MQLEIRNVSKTYRNGVKALKNVSLTIPPGMYGGGRWKGVYGNPAIHPLVHPRR